MEDFIYSLNATMPIFLVMAAGYFLRRIGLLNENFVTVANRFNFKVTLPILLFMQISAMDLQADFDPLYFFFCIGATLASILAIWLLSARLVKDRTQVGSFIQGAYRGSAAVLGVAFIQNIYGNAGLAPLMIVAAVPLYNIFAVIILTIYGEHPAGPQNSRGSIKRTLLNIVTNPIIIGIAAGVPFSLLHLRLPAMLDKTLASFADMSTPIALVAIGAGFEGGKALARLKPTLAAALIKLAVQPAVFLPIAIALGFRGQELVALLIMLGAPTTVSSYIMAKNMGNDGVLASSIIVATTVLSSITVTAWIFLLRSAGVL